MKLVILVFCASLITILPERSAGSGTKDVRFCRRPAGLTRFDCSGLSLSSIPTQELLPDFTTELDLSHNNIRYIGNESILRFFNLTTLKLGTNKLDEVPEFVDQIGRTLKNLDLGSNQIREIHKYCFSKFNQLENLTVEDNSLNILPNFVFSNQKELTNLSLRLNYISEIEEFAFSGLTSLKILKIDINFIDEKIERFNIWSPLTNLTLLDLSLNNFTKIDMSQFCVLTSLKTLLLVDSINLRWIHASDIKTTSCLVSLKLLDLSFSNILKIDTGALKIFKEILKLDLNFNPFNPVICFAFNASYDFGNTEIKELTLTMTSLAFQDPDPFKEIGLCDLATLRNLSVVYLLIESALYINSNITFAIKCLEQVERFKLHFACFPCYGWGYYTYYLTRKDIFQGLKGIQILDLSYNRFDSFYYIYNLTTLSELNLQNNQIKSLLNGAIVGLPNLKRLNLDSNDISTISAGFFTRLNNLTTLILSNNKIVTFSPRLFESLHILSELDLSQQKNLITTVSGAFDGLFELNILNLGSSLDYSYFTERNVFKDLKSLISINASDCKIFTLLSPDILIGLENIREIYVNHNQITKTDRLLFMKLKHLNLLNIDNNSNGLKLLVLNINEEMINKATVTNMRYGQLNVASLTLNSNNSILTILNMTGNLIESLEVFGNYSKLTKLDFSNNTLTRFTLGVSLAELKEILLQNNQRLTSILIHFEQPQVCYFNVGRCGLQVIASTPNTNNAFLNLINIRVLYLDKNTVEENYDKQRSRKYSIFQNLISLEILSASSCNISLLKPIFFSNLTNLKSLDMSHNQISQVVPEIFGSLVKLESLYLQGNPIQMVDTDTFKNMYQLKLMYAGDGLVCGCDSNLKNFKKWMLKNLEHIHLAVGGDFYESYVCSPSSTEVFRAKSIFHDDIDYYRACFMKWHLFQIYCMITASILCLLLVVTTFFVRNYWMLKYRWYMHKMKRRNYRPLVENCEAQYQYDAFVSYGSFPNIDDSLFVTNEMCQNLENRENSISLCLHERDFLPGNAIDENILEAIKASRKIIFVVSNNFVKSKYCMFEIQMALQILLSTGEDKMLFVIREAIPDEDMPPLLKVLINTRTYIEWPREEREQEEFWRRLHLALVLRRGLLPARGEEPARDNNIMIN